MFELQAHEIEMWLQIIRNIVLEVDHAKCDKATLGAWRQSLVACLTSVLKFTGTNYPSCKHPIFTILFYSGIS